MLRILESLIIASSRLSFFVKAKVTGCLKISGIFVGDCSFKVSLSLESSSESSLWISEILKKSSSFNGDTISEERSNEQCVKSNPIVMYKASLKIIVFNVNSWMLAVEN